MRTENVVRGPMFRFEEAFDLRDRIMLWHGPLLFLRHSSRTKPDRAHGRLLSWNTHSWTPLPEHPERGWTCPGQNLEGKCLLTYLRRPFAPLACPRFG